VILQLTVSVVFVNYGELALLMNTQG